MAFGNDALPTMIFQYGARRPWVGLDVVESQMRLAAAYRNALIARERERREQVNAALHEHHPEIPQMLADLASAVAARDAVASAIASRNAEAKRKRASKEEGRELAAAKERVRELSESLRERKRAVYGVPQDVRDARAALSECKRRLKVRGKNFANHPDGAAALAAVASTECAWHAANPFAAALAAIDADDLAARKQLREASGLYWGTYLVVENDCGNIRAGSPPEFVVWDGRLASDGETVLVTGEGRVAVQLQGGLSWADALACADLRLQIKVVHRKRRESIAVVRMRVNSDDKGNPVWAEVPVKLHREPPADAKIQWVHLHRERHGLRDVWSLSLFVSRKEWESDPQSATAGTVAIEVGWRRVEDGLRVAVWHSDTGDSGTLMLSEDLIDDEYTIRTRQSDMKTAFAAVRCGILERLAGLECPEWLTTNYGNIAQWESPMRLAVLWLEWQSRRFAGDEEAFAYLSAWFASWRKDTNELADIRKRMQTQRDYQYRMFVVGLRRRFHTAIIEATDWREVEARPGPDEPNDDAMRRWKRLGSVGRLSALCREGFAVCLDANQANTTRECFKCKRVCPPVGPEQYHVCEHCGAEWDVDENAACNLLAVRHKPHLVVETTRSRHANTANREAA